METEKEVLNFDAVLPLISVHGLPDKLAHRTNIAGMGVEGRDDAESGHVPVSPGKLVDAFKHAADGGGGILGKKGKDCDFIDTLPAKCGKRFLQRGLPVAHGKTQGEQAGFQPVTQTVRQVACVHDKGRTSGCPDLAVGPGDLSGAKGQDDAVQQQIPEKGMDVDHPRIGKELAEKGPHGSFSGGGGGT